MTGLTIGLGDMFRGDVSAHTLSIGSLHHEKYSPTLELVVLEGCKLLEPPIDR